MQTTLCHQPMPDQDQQSLEERLRSWQPALEPEPGTARKVLNRIASTDGREGEALRVPVTIRWLAAGGLAAALVLGVFLVSQQLEEKRILQDGSYVLMIDPVFRAHSGGHMAGPGTVPESGVSLVQQLAWMQDRLDLSRVQFMELVALHQDYTGRFDGLYRELVGLENHYAEFEERRVSTGMIDFIALYEVLSERRRTVDRSRALSREFIAKVAVTLRPDQRDAYLALVEPAASNRNDP